jgi:hypothetical protein
MYSEQSKQQVEVTFVGTPPVRRIERASGVSEVGTEGPIVRCLVAGSFQPFLEALIGHEVLTLTSTPAVVPGSNASGEL